MHIVAHKRMKSQIWAHVHTHLHYRTGLGGKLRVLHLLQVHAEINAGALLWVCDFRLS